MSTRTVEQEQNYQEQQISLRKKIGFCTFHDSDDRKPVQRQGSWVLFENDYPYKWADEHYLLFPKRHTNKLNEEEQLELNVLLKDYDNLGYVCLLNPEILRSVWCYHYHIIKPYIPNENN